MPTAATKRRTEPKTNVIAFEAASIRRLRQFAAALPAEFLECRQYGHAWTAYTVGRGKRTFEVTIDCMRCKSKAIETLDINGNREGNRRIRYVEGYLCHGMGRLDGRARAVLRLEGVHRLSE